MHTESTAPITRAIIAISLTVVLLLLFATAVAVAPPGAVYWHAASNGLPSDVQALTVTTAGAPPTLYVGTWGSGVYRSTDNGAIWVTATAGITLPMYIRGGLAVNPVTPTILYAGDYYGGLSGVGVYRSTDGGDSWTVSLADANIESLLVHPLTPTLVLAGDREDGLYCSTDSGDSWGSTSLPAQRVQTLVAAPSAPGPVYAGADSDLYTSADGGDSWTKSATLSSTVEALAVHPVTPTLVYAGTRRHNVWRSADAGTNWITPTVGLPSNAWVTSITLHPVTPTILYAGVWQGQVYRSEDGGDTWEGLGYLGPVEAVLVHPTAPSIVYAGTSSNGVFRGSTLDHLTIDPIADPQYVNHAFPIAVTARDALGFPLTGPSQSDLAALTRTDPALAQTLAAGGYDGTATLADATGTLTPTLVAFTDGIASTQVRITAEAVSDTITATVSDGPSVVSNPFDVVWVGRLYLPLAFRS